MKLNEKRVRLFTFNMAGDRCYFCTTIFFKHIPGVETMMDDVILWGSTREEQDERLRTVLDPTLN